MHYFVWLKAIPEQELATTHPVSFRLSMSYLVKDFGRKTVIWTVAVVVASLLMWALVALPQARLLYFSIAAFHGYLEIAGLGFLKLSAKS